MSVNKKFLLAVAILIALIAVIGSSLTIYTQKNAIVEAANDQADEASNSALRILTVTDEIMMARVRSSMKILVARGLEVGQPRLGSKVEVGSKNVPELYLGSEAQANDYGLVDELTADMGGTATLFVFDGKDYVRVSTNVQKAGKRATGTVLNPEGGAFRAIKSNQAFYGQVDILGSPYLTGYAPINNTAGEVIGIWYVGYSADMSIIADSISNAAVLENGFTALVDNLGRIRMHSDNQSAETIETALASQDGDWVITRKPFAPWGYEVISAYSNDDVSGMVASASVTVALIIGGIGVLIIAVISLLIKSVIARPMKALTKTVENIAEGEGDLTVRFNSTSKDEFGKMAKGFDKLLDKIQATIREVGDSASELLSSAKELSSIAEGSSKAASAQTRDTEHVASSMHEMSATAQNVAESASIAEEAAKNADTQAKTGHQLLQETIKVIEQQSKNISESVAAVTELDEHSNNISGVLDVIHSIAEQTNLLALNAAIEAARAGEHGRGFAVVSDEVRLLANRTQSSIDDIRTQIERLQAGSKDATSKMKSNQQLAGSISSKAGESGDAISRVLGAVSSISERNTDIASAAEEQSQVSEEISSTLERIRQNAEDTSVRVDETRGSSEALTALAERLKAQLAHYRV